MTYLRMQFNSCRFSCVVNKLTFLHHVRNILHHNIDRSLRRALTPDLTLSKYSNSTISTEGGLTVMFNSVPLIPDSYFFCQINSQIALNQIPLTKKKKGKKMRHLGRLAEVNKNINTKSLTRVILLPIFQKLNSIPIHILQISLAAFQQIHLLQFNVLPHSLFKGLCHNLIS